MSYPTGTVVNDVCRRGRAEWTGDARGPCPEGSRRGAGRLRFRVDRRMHVGCPGCAAARAERSPCKAEGRRRHSGRGGMAGVSGRTGCLLARQVGTGGTERGTGRTSPCLRRGRVAAPPEPRCRHIVRRNRGVPGNPPGLAGPRDAYPAGRRTDAGDLPGPGRTCLVRPLPAAERPRQATARRSPDRGRRDRRRAPAAARSLDRRRFSRGPRAAFPQKASESAQR